MTALRFQLFSSHCEVRDGVGSEEVRLLPVARNLLAYLLVHRHRSHSREALVDVFWKHDEKRARRCLSTTLWRLRRVLERGASSGDYLLVLPEGDIAFNTSSNYWLDIAAFEEGVQSGFKAMEDGLDPAGVQVTEVACAHYECDLLKNAYDDWAIRERERLRLLYLRAMIGLLRHYRRENLCEQGLDCSRRILHKDPLREEVHREMMRLFMRQGQRSLALRQYDECRAILAAELGIDPMPETKAVYRQIKDPVSIAQRATHGRPASMGQAMQQVNEAMQTVEQAQKQLKWAMQALVGWMDRSTDDDDTRTR